MIRQPITPIMGDLTDCQGRYAIIAAKFNALVVDNLVSGAIDTLTNQGIAVEHISLVEVPGAYELPLVAQRLAAKPQIDAVIALGAVIRGHTPHFDFVAGHCSKGLGQVALAANKPVIFGVLTTDTIEQALERAGSKAGNKGAEAAISALQMVSLLAKLANQ
jgi:6,7-dimethyl-8-ribityllumazine synthase